VTPHVPLFAGPAGDWLAVLGVVSVIYWVWRILAALIRYAQATPGEAEAPAAPSRASVQPGSVPAVDRLAADLPVIVAAVAAMLDRNRIVHIEEVPHGQVWSAQGRWLHQTSHRPH
jgi:hypothetical protein